MYMLDRLLGITYPHFHCTTDIGKAHSKERHSVPALCGGTCLSLSLHRIYKVLLVQEDAFDLAPSPNRHEEVKSL